MFLNNLREKLKQYHLLSHDFYKHYWTEGKLKRDNLADYAKQYYWQERNFVECLENLKQKLTKNSPIYNVVEENLEDEKGKQNEKTSHINLWLDFAKEFSVSKSDIESENMNIETRLLIETFKILVSDSEESAIGTFYAYEYQIPEIAKSKIEGLIKHYNVSSQESLSFFRVHMISDVWHTEQWESIINNFNEDQKEIFSNSAKLASKALFTFLDGMMNKCKLGCKNN